jgi:xylulokinase
MGLATTLQHPAVREDAARPLSLGIDVGTTNTKVALVSLGGPAVRVRAVASAPTPAPSALAPTLLALVRQVVEGEPAPQAIGIASMAETGAALDESGAPIGDWVHWNAERPGVEAHALARRLGWAELVAATGVRPSPKVPLAMLAWLRAHRPGTWSAMRRWAGVADLAGLVLTGTLVTDHTLAGRTMAYRLPVGDARTPASFDADLLAEVGLRPEHVPAVAGADEVAGHLSDQAFVSVGLVAGTPVVIAGHDHAVGAYAAGVRRPGDIADSFGTAEAVLSVVASPPDPIAVARAGMSAVVTVGGTHRAVLAGSPGAGALVQWWLDHEAAGWTADELFLAVLDLDDEPGDVLVLPYLHGRQTPMPDPDARLRVLGRHAGHTPAQLGRSLLEGLCLHARWMAAEQLRLTDGGVTGQVTAFGAPLLANPALLRIKSRVMPGTLQFVSTPEAVAAGAALVAAVRAGLIDPDDAVLDRETAPAVTGTDIGYDELFHAFVAAATAQIPQRGEAQ